MRSSALAAILLRALKRMKGCVPVYVVYCCRIEGEQLRARNGAIQEWQCKELKWTNANLKLDISVTRVALRSGGDDLLDGVQLRRIHHGLEC